MAIINNKQEMSGFFDDWYSSAKAVVSDLMGYSLKTTIRDIPYDEDRAKAFFREYARQGFLPHQTGDELASAYNSVEPSFLRNFGHAIIQSGLNDGDLLRVMENVYKVARIAGGSPDSTIFWEMLSIQPSSLSTVIPKTIDTTIIDTSDLVKKVAIYGSIGLVAYIIINSVITYKAVRSARESS